MGPNNYLRINLLSNTLNFYRYCRDLFPRVLSTAAKAMRRSILDKRTLLIAIHVCVSLAGIGFGASERASILLLQPCFATWLGARSSLLTAGGPEQSKCLKSKPQKRYARSATLISITRSKTLCNVQNVQVCPGYGDPQNEYARRLPILHSSSWN